MNKVYRQLIPAVFFASLMLPAFIALAGPPPPPGGGNNFTIRVFLQGFYTGGGEMREAQVLDGATLKNRFTSPIADKVTVELHTPGHYGQEGYTFAVNEINLINDGLLVVDLPTSGIYYLTIRTRNHLETVSAVTVNLATTSTYDFTTAASQAYGSNQAHLGGGVYGLFAGDVNQDGVINLSDRVLVNNDISIGFSGYELTDKNGDGVINLSDRVLVNNSISIGVAVQRPL